MPMQTPDPRLALDALRVDIAPGENGERTPPTALRLVPAGTFRARDGRPADIDGWRMTAANAAACIAHAQSSADDPVIDYEHQTLLAAQNGQPAPAAGWWRAGGMEYRDAPADAGGGLWATDLTWTPRAAEHIRAGEYRYFSPVIAWDRQTGDVRAVVLGALTNRAALDGLTDLSPLSALAAGIDLPQAPESPMDLTALRQALGLADDSDETAVLSEIATIKTARDAAETHVSTLREQIAAATRDSVPRQVHDEAIAALRSERHDHTAGELERLIETGLTDGRIPGKATADWLRDLGLDACREYLEDAPALRALRGTQTKGKPPAGAAPDQAKPRLDELEQAVCTQMGVSPDAYLTQRAALFPET